MDCTKNSENYLVFFYRTLPKLKPFLIDKINGDKFPLICIMKFTVHLKLISAAFNAFYDLELDIKEK